MIAATVAPSAAQTPPNLVGTWSGVGYAVHIGPTPYRTVEGAGVKCPDKGITFTYVIKEQHGNRFAGEMTDGKFKETVIGALQPDNRGGVMLDDDGYYAFTLVSPDAMDICYSHHNATSRLAGCLRLQRSR
jgi:hypothetical protein